MAEFNEELVTIATEPQASLPKRYKQSINSYFLPTSQNPNNSYEDVNLLSDDYLEGANSGSQNPTYCTSEECGDIDVISECTINLKWPEVWSSDNWTSKKQLHPWLYYKNGKLGCSICKHVSSLSIHKRHEYIFQLNGPRVLLIIMDSLGILNLNHCEKKS
ncbi:hypothetical protein LOD99_5043 [Oopsacas minuta]|uniref:Uncharacterized protein n=1 Tax=Oopsacas minuta TaxID=111878 RepID=A0AAV7JSV3_9METZ|nr:hypothetical protein LOD99_5043 [Oopsacas minuta]